MNTLEVSPISQRQRFLTRAVTRLARGRPMGIGAYMFVTHRLTAIALTIYLYVHLVTLGSVLHGPDSFDRAMALMDTPTVRLLELLLVWLVLFHTMNGLRLLVLAIAPGLNQRGLSYAVVIGSVLIVFASLPLFLK